MMRLIRKYVLDAKHGQLSNQLRRQRFFFSFAFGQPSAGFGLRSALFTALFQSPSILSDSGCGPGLDGFRFFFSLRIE
jgi:hypothetical protein